MAHKYLPGGPSIRPKKWLGCKSSLRTWTVLTLSLFMIFALEVSALQNPGQGEQTGARNAKVKPKRVPAGRDRNTLATIDDIHLDNFARLSAAQSSPVKSVKRQKLIVNAIAPGLAPRDRTSRQPLVTTVVLTGANLSGITARVVRGEQPLDSVVPRVENTTHSQAQIALAVAPNTPLGPAQLILSKPAYSDVAVDIRVIEPSEFAIEQDTVGLWRLDERAHGMANLLDTGQDAINLTSARALRVTAGRFKAARSVLRTTPTNNPALSPETSSFTVEGWVKAPPLERDYALVGKETISGETEFTLKLLASGALRAEIYDTNGFVWHAETLAASVTLTDDQWHGFALVVDRETRSLALYVDGLVQLLVPAPSGFGTMHNPGQPLQPGSFDAGASSNGPDEFPGILDEIRISSTAHKPEKIAADFFGNDEPAVTFFSSPVVRKAAGPIEVTLSGYGLIGATVLPNQPGVTATVLSSTLTSMVISLAVYDFVTTGPASLLFRDVLGRGFSVEFVVEERASENHVGVSGGPADLPLNRFQPIQTRKMLIPFRRGESRFEDQH